MDALERGIRAAAAGDLVTAIAACTHAIERNHPQLALAYRHRGHTYLRTGEWNRALADLTRAIELDPTAANAYVNRGVAFQELRDYARAIADHTEAIRLDKHLGAAYAYRGQTYAILGEFERAVADLNRAIAIGHESPVVLAGGFRYRGYCFWILQRYDKAMADFNQAIQLDPNSGLAFYYRGVAYEREGEMRKAQQDFAEAERLGYNPSDHG